MIIIILIYFLSLIISAGGAIWLLREQLKVDRERLRYNTEGDMMWLHIVGGFFIVILPIFNMAAAIVVVVTLLSRPVIRRPKVSK